MTKVDMEVLVVVLRMRLESLPNRDRRSAVVKIGPAMLAPVAEAAEAANDPAAGGPWEYDHNLTPLPIRFLGCPVVRDMAVPDNEVWIMSGQDGRTLGKVLVTE